MVPPTYRRSTERPRRQTAVGMVVVTSLFRLGARLRGCSSTLSAMRPMAFAAFSSASMAVSICAHYFTRFCTCRLLYLVVFTLGYFVCDCGDVRFDCARHSVFRSAMIKGALASCAFSRVFKTILFSHEHMYPENLPCPQTRDFTLATWGFLRV